jgi:hypothetical protein
VGGPAGSRDGPQAVGDQRCICPTEPRLPRDHWQPVSAMEESIDVRQREADSAVWESVRPELGWTLEFVLDDPGPALLGRSNDAALLVVGTHEHVGLARLVSGSISRYCLSHAHCPTVIVPVDSGRVDYDALSSEMTEQPTTAVGD